MKKVFLFLMACCLSLTMSARVAYLVPGNTNDKGQICTQWENHTFEHTAYDWFQETYVNAGVGDFINFTNIPTNANEYAAIWIYIDREWLRTGDGPDDHTPFDEGKFDALFNNDVVNALKTYVQNGGNLFLGKQAARLAYRMGRIGYAPNYQCGGYSQDDRFWGIKAKLGSGLSVENQRDRSSHAIYAGLATARMDNVDGCFPLLNATGDAHSTDNNIHWADFLTPNGEGVLCKQPNNNGDPALIEGWETYWNAKALGTWTSIGDYCIIQAVEFMPKDAFTGTILTINIGAYQWNSESTGVAADNMRKLTKNALRYLNRPSRADLRIDNAFKTCGRVDCGSGDPLYGDFMILHPVVEGLNAQPYTTSFEGIEEANRAVVEQWNDNGTNRLAFTKAGQVKLQINLRESRTDHFWPAGDYQFEQTINFAFSGAAPQTIVDEDLANDGLDPVNDNEFMVLHKNMRGLNATYTTNFDGIEEANRATVAIKEDGDYNRLTFTKGGSINLAVTLNSAEHNTVFGKGDHAATKRVTFAQPAFSWSHTPDVASVGEDKDPVAATCNVPRATVKFESDNTEIATIDENTGKITYIKQGTCNVYAYVEISGVKFSSEAQAVTVNGLNILWDNEPKASVFISDQPAVAAHIEYGAGTIQYECTNCSYSDGHLTFTAAGTATIRPYVATGGETYYGETKTITVVNPATTNPSAATAFLLLDAVSSLPQSERNCAEWFLNGNVKSGAGRYLAVTDLSNIPATVKTIIIHADRESVFDFSTYAEALKTWVKNGGNLVLMRQATILAYDMRRIDYAPHNEALVMEENPQQAGLDDRTETNFTSINVRMGTRSGVPALEANSKGEVIVDRSGDDFFNGMDITDGENGQKIITLNTATRRASNRCFWQEMYFQNPGVNNPENFATESRAKFDTFESKYNCQVLAVEAGILDFCLPAIIRFKSGTYNAETWKGSIMAIGAGGFQFNNENQANFEVLGHIVENAKEYVSGGSACNNCFTITIR